MSEAKRHLSLKLFLGALVVLAAFLAWISLTTSPAR